MMNLKKIANDIIIQVISTSIIGLGAFFLAWWSEEKLLYIIPIIFIFVVIILIYKEFCRKNSIILLFLNSLSSEGLIYWHMGRRGENAVMTIFGKFLITNNSKHNLMLTGAELRKLKSRGQVMLKELNSRYHSHDYILKSKSTTEITTTFLIEPPIKEEGESFIDDLGVIDQFGKKFWIKNVKFSYV